MAGRISEYPNEAVDIDSTADKADVTQDAESKWVKPNTLQGARMANGFALRFKGDGNIDMLADEVDDVRILMRAGGGFFDVEQVKSVGPVVWELVHEFIL